MALSQATSELQSKLRCVLDPTYRDWHAGELSIAGTGLETVVFHAWSPELGDVVFRVHWMRWISNDNGSSMDTRELLAKERLLANHMAQHGVPCPRARYRGAGDFDFLVSEYVHNDRSAIDVRALGQAIRRIHDVPVIVEPFRSYGSLSHDETLLERIRQRAKGIELAVVFFSEAPSPSRAHEQLRRVFELLTALGERSELHP